MSCQDNLFYVLPNVEILAISSRRWSELYSIFNLLGDGQPKRLLVIRYLSDFAYYLNFVLHVFIDDQAHIWRIAIEHSLFGNSAFLAARDGIALVKMADPCILSSACVMFVPLPSSLYNRSSDFCLFEIIIGTIFHPVFG